MTITPIDRPGMRRMAFALHGVDLRDSGNGTDYTVLGHAAVFNSLSEDLGGFRELIAPSAFSAVLASAPDVRLLFNHDPNMILARSSSGTLKMREDQIGLEVWARVAPTTYATDLRMMMQRGDVNQMSFAFYPGEDDWAVTQDGQIVRTILTVERLYDVSVVTEPAYAQTDAAMRDYQSALAAGRIPGHVSDGPSSATQDDPADAHDPSRREAGGDREQQLALLKVQARSRMAIVKSDIRE